jgi:hypothetical protein
MKFLHYAHKLSIKDNIGINKLVKQVQQLKLFQNKLSSFHKN